MYTGILCLILFDARGNVQSGYENLALTIVTITLMIKYIPSIFHRPHRIELFCEDLIHLTVHASCIALLPPDHLRYACALHSLCFVLQHRFLTHGAANTLLIHTIMCVSLGYAYIHGTRVSELKTFIAAVACPHVLDALSIMVVHVHKFAVMFLMDC